MTNFSKVRAIDFHSHAEEPCGCHSDEGYDDLQASMAKYFGVKGFKFHPTMQGFFPNDRDAYPLCEAIAQAGAMALFHTGQTGVSSGMRGGNGMRLKYSNPM